MQAAGTQDLPTAWINIFLQYSLPYQETPGTIEFAVVFCTGLCDYKFKTFIFLTVQIFAFPAYSIRKKFLIIPVFSKKKFLSQFLKKQKQKGGLTARMAIGQS